MSPLTAGAVALAADPSPDPTDGTLRPGLEAWQVSPGLIGFVVTFALAIACVLLFLNMSKHLRRAGRNAREQGLPVAAPDVIGFRRPEGDAAGTGGAKGPDAEGTSDAGTSSSDAGGSSDAGSSSSGGSSSSDGGSSSGGGSGD
jgi:uncharacterized membrane protein YgcG